MRWVGLVAGLAACGGAQAPTGPTGATAADTGAMPAPTVDTGPCGGAPVVTWENFGAGFVTQHCQACHASTAPDRHGAPEGVVFDTESDVAAHGERVRVRALDVGDMPPLGGVSDDDRARLALWLACDLGID